MKLSSGKKITEPLNYSFSVPENGIYAIFISARCRSGEQIKKRGGEDLRVEIDGMAFREIPALSKSQYQNIPVSWNGAKLQGAKQTVIFILRLQAGEHAIAFIPQEGAVIENEPRVIAIKDLSHIEFNSEEQAEEGDRRPWVTFAFIDMALQSFSAQISVKWHFFDGDDVKLVIDGEIQKNPQSVFHRDWLWSGFPFRNERQEKTFTPSLPRGIHYVEFWADRTPTLHNVKFNAGQSDSPNILEAKVVWESVTFRAAPTDTADGFMDIAKNERVAILEKAIVGKRIKNTKGDLLPTDRWHKVRYDEKEGYIYSLALEIEGEDKETIRQLIVQKSQEIGEDHCLMLAIAQRESQIFPYEVSDVGAEGVFQLKEVAFKDVNQRFQKNFSDRFDLHQNIEAGILYFQLVKEHYKNKDNFWERCLAGWNRGWGRVNPNKPFIFAKQPIATRQFIHDVEQLWKNCKQAGGMLAAVLLTTAALLLSASGLFLWQKSSFKSFSIPDAYAHDVVLTDQRVDIDHDGDDERLVVVSDNPQSTFATTKVLFINKDNSFVELPDDGGKLQWIRNEDFNKNGKADIAVLYGYSDAGFGHFYFYEWGNGAFKTLLTREDIGSKVDFRDMNNDGVKEIIYRFRPSKWSAEETDTYWWHKEKMRYDTLPERFPAVLFDEKNNQLDFFDHTGKLIKEVSAEQVRHDLKPPPEMADFDRLDINSEVLQSPDDAFYFFAATSYMCGATGNCGWTLYRLNADHKDIQLAGKDFEGSPSIYPSPDASRLAIVLTAFGGICYRDSYLKVIDLANLRNKEFDLIRQRDDYGVNSIESLAWQDNQHMLISIKQYDQPGANCPMNKPPREETKIITVAFP